jgi:probable selenium-dependent hydroxylase accessory protein YqeC
MDLADALELGARELVAFVGAGGKKTAMGRLVETGVARDRWVGYTTTTHTPPPDDLPLLLASPQELADALASEAPPTRRTESPAASDSADGERPLPEPLAFASERVPDPDRADEKLRGFEPSVVDEVFGTGWFDWLLVKADGARRREVKAPGPDEPQIPDAATVVVAVASVTAVGKPLTEAVAHRPERIAAVTGLERGAALTVDALATLLASPAGGRKGVPAGAAVVPMVNKADTPAARETAREVVAGALERTDAFEQGLVTSFEQGEILTVDG